MPNLKKINEIMKDIYTPIVARQLEEGLSILQQYAESHPPNPNHRYVSSQSMRTVAEFKQFLVDNNIPDDAEFSDTGYECDGSYYFTWMVEDGKQEG